MRTYEKLALFDVDGTLIDDSYQLTNDRIEESVEEAQSRNWHIGLSSDTPYEILVAWREKLGMNGPIIAEKGAVVEIDDQILFDKAMAAKVSLARKAITEYLSDYEHTTVWQGNSTEAIRNGCQIGDPGQRSILINNLSRCSLRFYVRRVSAVGSMVIDDPLTQETIEELAPFYPELDNRSIDNNPLFGLMIVGDNQVNKRTGLMSLLKHRSYERCIMVGNSMGDYIGDDLVEQYAVSNADADYKKKAIVLKRELTSGCIDVLDSLY